MMQIPRFGIKGLLIIVAAIALWFATFRMPDPINRGIGIQLRLAILLTVLIAAGFAAIYFRGKHQAFWAGFFVAMLLVYGQFFKSPILLLVAESWSDGLLRAFPASKSVADMLTGSMWAVLMLLFSAVVGLVVSLIYDQSRKQK